MNRYLVAFGLVWVSAWAVIAVDAGQALPGAPVDRLGFFIGQLATTMMVGVLLWLSRGQPAIDYRHELGVRRPWPEALGVLVYLVVVVNVVGPALGLRSHVGAAGLDDHSRHAWQAQSAASLVGWAAFYFVFVAGVPLVAFRYRLGYSWRSLLLRFPRPRRWVPYAAVTGAMSLSGFVSPAYFAVPFWGHLATVAIFALGTFIPVMVLVQSILAPRLAILSGSWEGGAVLAGIAYGVYHLREFYLEWHTLPQVAVSLSWVTQIAFFGVLKAITTLRTGNAWLHIFNTHLPHLAEAPEVVRVLSGASEQ